MADPLTLEQKAARLFWVTVYGQAGDVAHPGNRRAFGVDTPAEVVRRHRPGGIVLFAWADNCEHPEQVARLVRDLQATAAETGMHLAVAIDEEGGRVTRLGPAATTFPSARAVAAAADEAGTDLALRRWRAAAVELAAIGVTTNLAPVVDLANPWNPVVGDRAFGEDPATVARHAALAVRGLQEGGVAAVAKHFPGHGATAVDSHAALPRVELSRVELQPHLEGFGRLLVAEPPAGIMPGHLLIPALDPVNPATLSHAVLTALLRQELGYDGAIVTDSLSMAGIRGRVSDSEVAVAALAAGADVLLLAPDMPGAVAAVCRAVRDGALNEERLDRSIQRAQAMLLTGESTPTGQSSVWSSGVGHPTHRCISAEIARAAISVTGELDRLPLGPESVVVVGVAGSGARGLADALADRGVAPTLLEVGRSDVGAARLAAGGQQLQASVPQQPDNDPPVLGAVARGATIVFVRRVPEIDGARQDALWAAVAAGHDDVVLIETGGGGVHLDPTPRLVVRTHDASDPALAAAATVLAGAPQVR